MEGGKSQKRKAMTYIFMEKWKNLKSQHWFLLLRSLKVDVSVVTYNSGKTLDKCLNSIEKYVPVNRLLIGDGGSTDNTLKIARDHGAKIYLFRGEENKIGRIRYKLAELAETDWLLYVDSDVYLYQTFWPRVSRYVMEGVGMIMAAQDGHPSPLQKYFEWRNRKFGFITFSNTLVPRAVLLKVKELLNTHTGEDAIYGKRILEMGLKIVRIYEHLSFHDKDIQEFNLAFRRWGADLRTKKDVMELVKTILRHFRNTVLYTVEEQTLEGVPILLSQCFELLKGYLILK